jgi:hypothetical protein
MYIYIDGASQQFVMTWDLCENQTASGFVPTAQIGTDLVVAVIDVCKKRRS